MTASTERGASTDWPMKGVYAAAIRSTLIARSRWREPARSKANCIPSQVSGVEPKAFDNR